MSRDSGHLPAVLFDKMDFKLSKRLQAASAFVKKGSVVADIGCDHAYLPIYLIEKELASRVIAADINKGPCDKAKENIRKKQLDSVIQVVQTDGLKGLEDFGPDTVVICGMGGDLIFKIISSSDYTKNAVPLLILQPQTKQGYLRKALLEIGYNIIDEALCIDDRLYEIIVAKYDGISRSWTETELLCGKRNIEKCDPLLGMLTAKLIQQYETVIKGKKKATLDTSKEEIILKELEELRNDGNRAL